MGKLEGFDITFDHPRGVYYAGEVLRGQVIMNLSEPMKMRSLRIWLFGRAKVRWEESRGGGKSHHTVTYRTEEVFIEENIYFFGEGLTIDFFGKGKVHWKERRGKNNYVHHRSEEIYVNEKHLLFGSEHGDAEEHPAGNHVYDFELYLSPDMPSSFEGEYGYVRYVAKAIIDKPWKFDHETKTAFTVINQLDLNKEPVGALTGMEGSDSQEASCCCCVSGTVTASVQIGRRGFVPGETIIINAQVHNGSNSDISGTRVALKQYIEFYGVSDSLFSSGVPKPKTVSALVGEISREEVEAGTTQTWENACLRIPPVPPSRLVGCNCINIAYVLKFYVGVPCGSEIKLVSDITIGTIPLRSVYESAMGVVTAQPTAPPVPYSDTAPSAPADDWIAPPPSYESALAQQVSILEEEDSEYTRGSHQFAPAYPYYTFDGLDSNYK